MTEHLKALAVMLKNARLLANLTLREVEAKTEISNAYLSQIEGAKIKQPSPQLLHKLCNLYGCSYAATMELAGYPLPGEEERPTKSQFAARLGKTSKKEEEALLEYLQFLRSRKK